MKNTHACRGVSRTTRTPRCTSTGESASCLSVLFLMNLRWNVHDLDQRRVLFLPFWGDQEGAGGALNLKIISTEKKTTRILVTVRWSLVGDPTYYCNSQTSCRACRLVLDMVASLDGTRCFGPICPPPTYPERHRPGLLHANILRTTTFSRILRYRL